MVASVLLSGLVSQIRGWDSLLVGLSDSMRRRSRVCYKEKQVLHKVFDRFHKCFIIWFSRF